MKTLLTIAGLFACITAFSQTLEKGRVIVTSTSTFILQDDVTMNEFINVSNEVFEAYNKAFNGMITFKYALGDRGPKKTRFMNIMILDLEIRNAIWPCEGDNESEGCEGNGMFTKIIAENKLTEQNQRMRALSKSWTDDDESQTDWIIQ
jgi:hypothetical protein